MTDIKLFDTMRRAVVPFVPQDPARVLVYVCGPTVYDEPHLGHARSGVVFDVLVRLLRDRYGGAHVVHIRNYTDVDDKIIVRAQEMGVAIDAVTERYIAAYDDAMASLGCRAPDVAPRVTAVMADIVRYIEQLIATGAAYVVAGGAVYYAVKAFPAYGKLSHRTPDELGAVHRVEADPRKRDPLDFALWKDAKPGEPQWPSPWGPGRPGWHIECSVMATRFGAATLDIHGGGQDLVFPHHENEIAQCEVLTQAPFAHYWVHNGFVQINAEKMSKSLRNYKTVGEILRVWPAAAVRYFLLSSHYRSPLDFSEQGLAEATKAVLRIVDGFAAVAAGVAADAPAASAKQEQALQALTATLDGAAAGVAAALADDLDTPAALATLFDAVRELNRVARGFARGLPSAAAPMLAAAARLRARVQDLLGLAEAAADAYTAEWNAKAGAALGIDAAAVTATVAAREQARQERRFADADALRQSLAAQGVVVEDGVLGSVWRVDPDAMLAARA